MDKEELLAKLKRYLAVTPLITTTTTVRRLGNERHYPYVQKCSCGGKYHAASGPTLKGNPNWYPVRCRKCDKFMHANLKKEMLN